MKNNLIKIISSITAILTFCMILWGIFSYTGTLAKANDLNAKFELAETKIEVNKLSLQEYRIENEIMYIQKRIWSKQDRLQSCSNWPEERKVELKDDIRKLKQQLKFRENELEKVKSKIESEIDRVE